MVRYTVSDQPLRKPFEYGRAVEIVSINTELNRLKLTVEFSKDDYGYFISSYDIYIENEFVQNFLKEMEVNNVNDLKGKIVKSYHRGEDKIQAEVGDIYEIEPFSTISK